MIVHIMPLSIFRKIFAFLTVAATLQIASLAQAQERPLTLRVVQSGHSLTDGIMAPLKFLVASEGARGAMIDKSTIPGSPIDWRWNNSDRNNPTDARYNISRYDVLVLTERAPLTMTMPSHKSPVDALRWFTHAWNEGNGGQGAETILYASWANIDSGPDFENPYKDPDGHIPFRERLPREMRGWEGIQSYVNENRPAGTPPMRIIPGPRLMAAIYDEIEAGRAPGLTDISDLFADGIHLSRIGEYFMALAHFAVIYERDPRGLQNFDEVSPEQAIWMQDLVWRILTEYNTHGWSE